MRRVHFYSRRQRKTKETLIKKEPLSLFEYLLQTLGPQRWWPGDSPLEIAIGAILTQNTNWNNVKKAIDNLKKHNLLDLDKLLSIPLSDLESLIKPAGYFRIKARRLKEFLNGLKSFGGFEKIKYKHITEIRDKLLRIKGIGHETADSIILYSLNLPVFVIDTYTKRILNRHGISPGKTYEDYRLWFESKLPRDSYIFNEFHALLVSIGKNYCKRKPNCQNCPVKDIWGLPNEP